MSIENTFWRWAVALWRSSELESQLLQLQDSHGLVVLELLFAAWLGDRGVKIAEPDRQALQSACDCWVKGVVIPLREQRKQWADDRETQWCRDAIKTLELQAEKKLSERLVAVAQEQGLLRALHAGVDGPDLDGPDVNGSDVDGPDEDGSDVDGPDDAGVEEAMRHNITCILRAVRPPINESAAITLSRLVASIALTNGEN